MSKTKQTYHRKTGLLEIECGRCGHEQKSQGELCGGYNPITNTHEETYFIFGSAADVCGGCNESFGRTDADVEITKI